LDLFLGWGQLGGGHGGTKKEVQGVGEGGVVVAEQVSARGQLCQKRISLHHPKILFQKDPNFFPNCLSQMLKLSPFLLHHPNSPHKLLSKQIIAFPNRYIFFLTLFMLSLTGDSF
jgi:hypothetical protein